MAKRDITNRDFRDAAIGAAVKLGRLTELKVVERDGSEVWTMKAELDPERLGCADAEASALDPVAPSAQASGPTAGTVEAESGAVASECLIDKREVARRLDVGLRTLESMISGGKIPDAVRPTGRLVRWRTAEIDAWVRAGCPDRASWQAMGRVADRGGRRGGHGGA